MAQLRTPVLSATSSRKNESPLSLDEFIDHRNDILFVRGTGGLGDILMHRMLFEDVKLLIPEARITFAIPAAYIDAAKDHPFLDHVTDFTKVDPSRFVVAYNTTTSCGRYENKKAPLSDKHRADIWADSCGFRLTRHDMHLRLSKEEEEFGRNFAADCSKGKKLVVFSPISAMASKNLDKDQMNGVAASLREMGFSVVCLHNTDIPDMKEAPVWRASSIRQWMSVINAADAVVSVDTSTFHCAGGFKRPLVGVFTWACGLSYGKWFDFVLVQKHRSFTPGWNCGPCYKWHDCPLCPNRTHRKPCVSDLSVSDIMTGVREMIRLWPQLRPSDLPFNQIRYQDQLAPSQVLDPAATSFPERVSVAVAVVKAGNSSADRLAVAEPLVPKAI